jgi:hypothetical protein
MALPPLSTVEIRPTALSNSARKFAKSFTHQDAAVSPEITIMSATSYSIAR